MKKNPSAQAAAEGNRRLSTEKGSDKPRQHGPQKEKTQLTVRLDKELMDQAYQMIQETNQRITDVLERGLVLVLKEEEQLPRMLSRVRFLVANATREQQEQIMLFLTFLVLEELTTLTPPERLIHTQTCEYLKLLKKWRNETMHRYSRYGKTPDEVEPKTGS